MLLLSVAFAYSGMIVRLDAAAVTSRDFVQFLDGNLSDVYQFHLDARFKHS
jgi:hypothetical protein